MIGSDVFLQSGLSVDFQIRQIAAADHLQYDADSHEEYNTGHQTGRDGVLAALSEIEGSRPAEDAGEIADECNGHQDFLQRCALFQLVIPPK